MRACDQFGHDQVANFEGGGPPLDRAMNLGALRNDVDRLEANPEAADLVCFLKLRRVADAGDAFDVSALERPAS